MSDSSKCVRFEERKPTIHYMHAWKFAYHEARCGKWQQTAHDRIRFQRRIEQIDKILTPIFVEKKKCIRKCVE